MDKLDEEFINQTDKYTLDELNRFLRDAAVREYEENILKGMKSLKLNTKLAGRRGSDISENEFPDDVSGLTDEEIFERCLMLEKAIQKLRTTNSEEDSNLDIMEKAISRLELEKQGVYLNLMAIENNYDFSSPSK